KHSAIELASERSSKRIYIDYSEHLVKALSIPFDQVPPFENLESFLQETLIEPIPVRTNYVQIHCNVININKMIKDETENIDLNGNFIMIPLISLLAENALGLTITEGSEMDQGSIIDKLIKDPLTTLSEKDDNIEISMARNLTDNSTATTKKSCPDFSV
ncbi:13477_t:CDS:1, partial [Entrophospora sp. SA101]